jgi:hypothetical protein
MTYPLVTLAALLLAPAAIDAATHADALLAAWSGQSPAVRATARRLFAFEPVEPFHIVLDDPHGADMARDWYAVEPGNLVRHAMSACVRGSHCLLSSQGCGCGVSTCHAPAVAPARQHATGQRVSAGSICRGAAGCFCCAAVCMRGSWLAVQPGRAGQFPRRLYLKLTLRTFEPADANQVAPTPAKLDHSTAGTLDMVYVDVDMLCTMTNGEFDGFAVDAEAVTRIVRVCQGEVTKMTGLATHTSRVSRSRSMVR